MKKALIYDSYTVYGGAERCNETFNTIWPDLEYFALIDFLNSAGIEPILNGKSVKTSFVIKHYRKYLPLFPYAIGQTDPKRILKKKAIFARQQFNLYLNRIINA